MKELFSKLNFAQAFALAAIIAGVTCSLIFVPPGFWDKVDWKWLIGMLVAGGGISGSALLGQLVHPKPVRGPHSVRPPKADA